MHGVKWGSQTSEGELARMAAFSELGKSALEKRTENDMSEEAEGLIRRVVEGNPDDYTLWNFRREWLRESGGRSTEQELVEKWEKELRLTEKALLHHPKAYAAWQHRVWLLSTGEEVGISAAQCMKWFKAELHLCDKMLRMDARNFHAWAHKARVMELSGEQRPEEVVAYTTDRINADFSNYSAWHYRSVNLAQGHPEASSGSESVLRDEIERLRQAFYTDPDSQSAWFYYRWLLDGAPYYSDRGTKNFCNVDHELLESELNACEELIELEPEAKWALSTKVFLLERLDRTKEAASTIGKLMDIDPMRSGYYRAKLARLGGCH